MDRCLNGRLSRISDVNLKMQGGLILTGSLWCALINDEASHPIELFLHAKSRSQLRLTASSERHADQSTTGGAAEVVPAEVTANQGQSLALVIRGEDVLDGWREGYGVDRILTPLMIPNAASCSVHSNEEASAANTAAAPVVQSHPMASAAEE